LEHFVIFLIEKREKESDISDYWSIGVSPMGDNKGCREFDQTLHVMASTSTYHILLLKTQTFIVNKCT